MRSPSMGLGPLLHAYYTSSTTPCRRTIPAAVHSSLLTAVVVEDLLAQVGCQHRLSHEARGQGEGEELGGHGHMLQLHLLCVCVCVGPGGEQGWSSMGEGVGGACARGWAGCIGQQVYAGQWAG